MHELQSIRLSIDQNLSLKQQTATCSAIDTTHIVGMKIKSKAHIETGFASGMSTGVMKKATEMRSGMKARNMHRSDYHASHQYKHSSERSQEWLEQSKKPLVKHGQASSGVDTRPGLTRTKMVVKEGQVVQEVDSSAGLYDAQGRFIPLKKIDEAVDQQPGKKRARVELSEDQRAEMENRIVQEVAQRTFIMENKLRDRMSSQMAKMFDKLREKESNSTHRKVEW